MTLVLLTSASNDMKDKRSNLKFVDPASATDGDRNGNPRCGADVGINLTWLTPGLVGGSEEHAVQLLRGLASLDDLDLNFSLYATREFEDVYPDICQRWPTNTMPWPRAVSELVPKPVTKVVRILFENSWLAAATRRDSVVHHLGGSVPLVRAAPAIVTIHDLQPWDMPENFSPPKRFWLRWLLPRSVRSALKTLCPSGFTAQRIQDCFGADGSSVEVVPYSCPDPSRHPGQPHWSTAEWRAGADPYSAEAEVDPLAEESSAWESAGLGLDVDPFLLYPAIPYAHKRHIDIVETLTLLAPEYPLLSVVFTGSEGPETESIKERAERLGVADRVHFLGRVPAGQLDWLYRHALAMVFPSSYEGFGNPVLEAMARGCPVVVSSAGSLPEVAGEAGLVVEVGDIREYATTVASMLEQPQMVRRMAAKSRARYEEVDPAITAARTAAVYREVLSNRE